MSWYKSKVIQIGNLQLGGDYPVRLQSMTNTDTMDTEATVSQAIRMIKAGAEMVRITAPGLHEAANLANIRNQLHDKGFIVPLIADIHFNPKAAELAASFVEKVRINPGNYVGKSVKINANIEYSELEYLNELEIIKSNLKPLVSICNDHGTAIRIGVNHGSLGGRIISRYGDTVEGMVVSALEYARIFESLNFNNLVISVKSSNTVMMLNAYRELAIQLQKENLNYPLHIGVTEAGEGNEGRMKSIAGIGAVLASGIGDTIRVSLTEEPEFELPVAKEIVKRFNRTDTGLHPHNYQLFSEYAGLSSIYPQPLISGRSEKIYGGFPGKNDPAAVIIKRQNQYILADPKGSIQILPESYFLLLDRIPADDELSIIIEKIREHKAKAFIIKLPAQIAAEIVIQLRLSGCAKPVILMSPVKSYTESEMLIENCLNPGALLMDGFGQGICIEAEDIPIERITMIGYGILQATRIRITDTEYIACPSCGRTHFNIQQRLREVKEATSGLTGLKIAVMGCIVNGPGEMADADYGYVGAGKGKVTLYKGKMPVLQSVPEEKALDELLKLIRERQ